MPIFWKDGFSNMSVCMHFMMGTDVLFWIFHNVH